MPEVVFKWDEPYVRIPVTIRVPPGTPIGEHAWEIGFATKLPSR